MAHNPNQMQIVLRLFDLFGEQTWVYEIIQRGEVIKTFFTAQEAADYI